MSDLKKEISDELKVKRPNLSASSLKTYSSLLTALYRTLNGTNGIEFFNDDSKILVHIDGLEKAQTKKTLLSCLYVLTGITSYQNDMHKNIKVVNESYRQQKTNPVRLAKLKTSEEILAIHEEIKSRYKKNPTVNNIIDILISYLVSGALGEDLPPRRVLDYSLMKLRNYDTKIDNYIKAGKFYFNQYKTKDRYGSQVIDIPKELNTLINKWKKINESDYLLVNEDNNEFTSTSLSKKISRLFDGNSMDMLRSIFLSNYYRDMPKLSRMENLASKMGHSTLSALNYYVKDDE